jgi:hypothetical protein
MAMNPELTYTATTRYFWPTVEIWCVDNIGGWNIDWYRVHADLASFIDGNDSVTETYHFRTSEQATLFALRWS